MNKAALLLKGRRLIAKSGLLLRKHSHEILTYGGIVGGIGAAVLACKATLKLEDTLDEGKDNITYVKESFENAEEPTKEERKELSIAYGQTTLNVVKLYLPAVTLGVASVASILAGHNIISKRSAAYAAAYTSVNDAFKGYRERVAAKYGEEAERDIYFDKHDEEIVTENEDGSTDTTTIETSGTNYSPFAVFFDSTSSEWKNDPEANKFFLMQQERWCNERLKRNGFLTINEVYDCLDLPKTTAGMVAGWIYDEEHPVGDNMVNFNLDDATSEATRRFMNGLEPVVLLDFNIDGDIYKLMD